MVAIPTNSSTFLKTVPKCCIDIKIHLFDRTLTPDTHLRCDFAIGIKEMLEDEVDGILDVVVIAITQGSDVIHVDKCDYLLP